MEVNLFISNSDAMALNKNKLGGGTFVNTGRSTIGGANGHMCRWCQFMALSSF